MRRGYDQFCAVAHALDLVGERWALLVVRELMRGPKRYTDLAETLGIGTNILAARLRELEAGGILTKKTLPPPSAARVYELTDYGRALKSVIRELALWGARSLGPPTEQHGELFPGWLDNALDTVLAPVAPPGRFEFRVGSEVASLEDGEARPGPIDDPDVVVEADADGIYHLFVDRRLDLVTIHGDRELLLQLIDAAPAQVAQPAQA
jgi:DNA-binding HxlR family transcriptional regulator